GQHLQGGRLGLFGRVAGAFEDVGPRLEVVGDVVGGLPGVVEVFFPVGVDEWVERRVPAAVHLLQGAVVAAAADRGPDADLRAGEEHVGGGLQRDGADVVAGEVVVPGPGEAVQGALDVGEERVAAPPGQQPDRAGLDRRGHAVEVDRERLGEHFAGRL